MVSEVWNLSKFFLKKKKSPRSVRYFGVHDYTNRDWLAEWSKGLNACPAKCLRGLIFIWEFKLGDRRVCVKKIGIENKQHNLFSVYWLLIIYKVLQEITTPQMEGNYHNLC